MLIEQPRASFPRIDEPAAVRRVVAAPRSFV